MYVFVEFLEQLDETRTIEEINLRKRNFIVRNFKIVNLRKFS